MLHYKRKAKSDQKRHYDKGATVLKPLHPGDIVKMHHGRGWNIEATLVKGVAPRSYDVITPEGVTYRRNRRHLLHVPQLKPEHPSTMIWESFFLRPRQSPCPLTSHMIVLLTSFLAPLRPRGVSILFQVSRGGPWRLTSMTPWRQASYDLRPLLLVLVSFLWKRRTRPSDLASTTGASTT